MNGEQRNQVRTNYKPKENIDKNFTINSNYHEKTRRHYTTSPGEKKVVETPKGRKHIKAPYKEDNIVFNTPIEKARPKPFEKPRPNTKPEFHSKKFTPSRPILKSHNESSISFDNYSNENNNIKRNVNTRVDPASLPAAGTKTGFYGIR
ncbi:hypothetical protein BCR32DRAFT_277705 [Anaeromyces robustus]|uniref:Uncharacterized protein n=1 Tax=Anaeromyces robustus TaxID=1754192 RepID=A0A1Y1XDF9_9FUNG|nr:hypothetical protein BCR32DRAFT_277705 [Anaeromyces robustus]|eukprot:ORX83788.1 hypothetical protein BCR32DRAFT_277705 [Anaeromyces robustus]